MKKNERIIQYFDIGLVGKTRARDMQHTLVSPRTIDELMTEFSVLRELNKARKKVSAKSKQEYRLEDMEELDGNWLLLINVVDTEAAHPVTQKLDGTEDDREIIELGDDRGLESSSHVLISKQPNEAGKHLCLFEKNATLPFSKAMSFLNHLCLLAAKCHAANYKFPHPSGEAGRTYNAYCRITFVGHPSDDFKEELESGVIKGIQITSDMTVVRGYDSEKHGDLIGTDIKMKVGRLDVLRSGGNWNHLKRAIDHADTLNSPYVRISFTDQSGAGHSATLSSDTGQILDADKYIKKRKIEGFGNALRTAFPVIHDGIKAKMIGVMGDE
ncbi:hypothetical protein [Neptuniibacter sp.]|uniref:hypothetical protein n=1 Tax=Neptuniibacter sp. TaxID=1962643 RepID=UPI003B5A46E8